MHNHERHPANAPGNWHVDTSCLNCETCFGIAPDQFRAEFATLGQTIVSQQPTTDEEEALMQQAKEACCTGAIKNSSDNPSQDETRTPKFPDSAS